MMLVVYIFIYLFLGSKTFEILQFSFFRVKQQKVNNKLLLCYLEVSASGWIDCQTHQALYGLILFFTLLYAILMQMKGWIIN